MKKLSLILILFLAPKPAQADDWTAFDTALELSYAAVTTLDWSQTNWASHHPPFYEENKLLGPHPSRLRTGVYFPAMILLHAGIAVALPKPWRGVWQAVGIGVEMEVVRANFAVGVRLSF